MSSEPLYRTPEAALRAAYGALARPHYSSPSLWRDLAGGTVRGPAVLSAFDRIAQAGATLQRTRLTLRPELWLLVEARYRIVANKTMRAAKESDALQLSRLISAQRGVSHEPFGWDVTREWCGLRPERGVRAWSRYLGKHKATLHRWRYHPYRPNRRPGIITVLDDWHDGAMAQLTHSFSESGIC